MGSEDGDSEFNGEGRQTLGKNSTIMHWSGLESSGTAWLTAKLRELEELKRVSNAKIDQDIAAVKQLLSC